MSEKITLTRYLQGRGEVKALTHIEALAFGVPYPLQPGWPRKYGPIEITEAMLDDLRARIATAKGSTASKAQRGLDGLMRAQEETKPAPAAAQVRPVTAAPRAVPALPMRSSPVPGFVPRLARRYRKSKSAPWA
ncbi:hypothetical protein [Herbaspirillum sp. SJZ107]|uniref:hypothetical protein n=1 Tax=Herbaspirillum sp. SJZ107 TaxID=2572881 RepID=UPI0011529EED|nr:hypothetical protein [Herbaspirillum sp. SJZ107]TQK10203.1 hypothetical protein FBX97_0119 [Herbaspirillum sp. SJZ107]